MKFTKQLKNILLASTIGFILAWLIVELFKPYYYYHTMDQNSARILLGCCYLAFVLYSVVAKNTRSYFIDDNRLAIKSLWEDYTVNISDIDCVKQTWASINYSNVIQYQIIMIDQSKKPIVVDLTLLNEAGQSLITVLESQYNKSVMRL